MEEYMDNGRFITFQDLIMLRITPIKKRLFNWILQLQIKSRQRQIDVLKAKVKNDNLAIRLLNTEIINLHNLTD